jgi:hypothetical protein
MDRFHPYGCGGTALVTHGGSGDEVTDPAGNSGGRMASGVIVRVVVAQVPGQLPRTSGGPAARCLLCLSSVQGQVAGWLCGTGAWCSEEIAECLSGCHRQAHDVVDGSVAPLVTRRGAGAAIQR